MRICVFGAGAVGSHFAVRLALAGHDVSCVMRGAHLDAVKADGLTLRVGNGEFKAEVRASSDPATLGRQDAVICALKATGLSSLAEGLQPLLGEDTAVVFAQNGVPWWYDIGLSPKHPPVPDLAFLDPGGRLRAAIPKQLIVGGVVFSSNEVVAPGVVANSPAIAGTSGSIERSVAAETKPAMARKTTGRAGSVAMVAAPASAT